jgi:hypothetical protein
MREFEDGRIQSRDGIVEELDHCVGYVLQFRREFARSADVFECVPETSCDCRNLKHTSSLCLYREHETRISRCGIGIPPHGRADAPCRLATSHGLHSFDSAGFG